MFIRNLTYKFLFDKDRLRAKEEREFSESIKHFRMEEFWALRDLMLLLDENNDTNPIECTTATPPTIPSSLVTKFKSKS